MDVACPKCQTEYDLEDARVPEDGVMVKCSACGHVFRAKRQSLIVAVPVTAAEAKAASPTELPPATPVREWKLRQPSGAVSTCRELTALQRWIVEGKVSRDDEISLTGETWKRLGDIPELASFFRVVEDASRVRSYEAMRPPGPLAPSAPRPGPLPSVPRAPGSGPLPRPSGFGGVGPGASPGVAARGSGTFPALSPSGGSRPPFETGSSPPHFQPPRVGGATPTGLSPVSATGGVPRTSGVFPAPTGIATPTAWSSGVYPALPGYGSAPSRPQFSATPSPSTVLPPPSGSGDPAFAGAPLGPRPLPPVPADGRQADPAFTAHASSFDAVAGRGPSATGSGLHRAYTSPSSPGLAPEPKGLPPLEAPLGGLGQRQTLRGPQFPVPSSPPPSSLSFALGGPSADELHRARRLSAWILVGLGLLALAGAAFAYRERASRALSAATGPASSERPPLAVPTPVVVPAMPVTPAAAQVDAGSEASAEVASAEGGLTTGPAEVAPAADGGPPEGSAAQAADALAEPLPKRTEPAAGTAPRTAAVARTVAAGKPAVVEAGRPADAKRAFDGLIERADRLRERERPEAALDLYGKAHELKPERVEPVAGRGLSLLDLRNLPAAQAAFHQALKLNERYGPAIMGLAEAYRIQGNHPKAVEFYQRYLEVLPEGVEAAVARNNIQRLKP